jgi:hypothetical protein
VRGSNRDGAPGCRTDACQHRANDRWRIVAHGGGERAKRFGTPVAWFQAAGCACYDAEKRAKRFGAPMGKSSLGCGKSADFGGWPRRYRKTGSAYEGGHRDASAAQEGVGDELEGGDINIEASFAYQVGKVSVEAGVFGAVGCG